MRYMKKYMQRLWRRSLAFLLCCLCLAMAVFFIQAARYAWNRDWYTGGSMDFADTNACENYVSQCDRYVLSYVEWKGEISAEVATGYGGSAYACVVTNTDTGAILLDTTTEQSVMVGSGYSGRYDYTEEIYFASGEVVDSPALADEVWLSGRSMNFKLQGYVNLPVEPYSGCYAEYRVHALMAALAPWAIPMAILCALAAGALGFFLALWKLRWQDVEKTGLLGRIPADALVLGLGVLGLVFSGWGSDAIHSFVRGMSSSWVALDALVYVLGQPVWRAFVWTAAVLLLALAVMEQARRKQLRRRLLVSRVPVFGRIGLCLAAMLVLGGVILFDYWRAFGGLYGLVPACLALLALAVLAMLLLWQTARRNEHLRQTMEALASGDLEHKIDLDKLPPGLREQGECLNRIGEGMKAAVDQQLRGERFKTELITNVSHDLKTPITSIVSYVDLLKKENVSPEQAREYIEVIDRQSGKLKKLTEDLVEASKASAGAIKVQREPVDVAELLGQSVGEYTQRLEAVQVEPLLSLPEEECLWSIDGRLLWRVLENLIQNIVKYAQPGTRAYFDLKKSEKGMVIELKNTSAQPLNIPAEELLARFVRGDGARHSEGSGLGLSIAQSLTELLGGTMTLYLDGDLFKVSLRFDETA